MKTPEDFGITKYTWRDGVLDCHQNVDLRLKSLKKLPFIFGVVDGNFNCSYNRLTYLEGCPKTIKGSFYCNRNELTSLIGCTEVINGNFNCSNNLLKRIEDITSVVDSVYGDININDNKFILSLEDLLLLTKKYSCFYENVNIVENPNKETTIENLRKKILIFNKIIQS